MIKRLIRKIWNNKLLILAILAGGVLRFYRLRDLTTFGGDQGIDYLKVWQMISERRLSFLGPITHVGIYLGPLYYYLLIPFFLLFKFDPIAAPFFFALVGTTTVGLVYVLAKKIFITIYACLPACLPARQARQDLRFTVNGIFPFLAALLYSVSPVILESSRAPSQPHLIPFFATLLLISIIRTSQKKEKWWDGLIIGISLASTIQFHYLAFPLWIFTGMILTRRMSNDLNHWTKGFWPSLTLPIIILLAPLGLFEIRHQFFITHQIINYLKSGEISLNFMDFIIRSLKLTWFSFNKLIGQGLPLLTAAVIVLAITGWIKMCHSSIKLIFGLYFLINILGLACYFDPFSNHYISTLYPVIILLTVFGIKTVFGKYLGIIGLIILILFNFLRNDFSRSHGYTMPDQITTTSIQKTARLIAGDVKLHGKTFNIVNTLDGDTRAYPYRYVLTAKLKTAPLGVETYSPADYLYIISDLSENELLADNRWELASFPVMETAIIGMISQQGVNLYRWKNGAANRKDLIQ